MEENTEAKPSNEELLSELAALRQEVTRLKAKKADMELLLELSMEHSDTVETALLDKVETTLRESQKRFRLIAETTPVPVVISRVSDGSILYANTQTNLTFGLLSEQLPDRRMPDFYYDSGERQELLAAIAQAGYVQNYEIRARKADGSPFWVAVSIRPLTFNDEPCLLSAFYDLTVHKQAEEERAQFLIIQQELNLARQIQESLLPSPRPDWPGLDVVCYTAPAREVGGDFYAYHAFNASSSAKSASAPAEQPGCFAIAVGDVSGKGMPAALLMAVSFASLQAVIARAFDPGELLGHLDRAIGFYTQTTGQNCALCYAEIIPPHSSLKGRKKRGIMRVANAGCIPPLIRRADGTIEWVDVGGLPLGLEPNGKPTYDEVTLKLATGDLVILTSDGLVEAMTMEGRLFGFGRLEEAAAAGPTTSAGAMLAHLRAAVAAFVGQTEAHDDFTMVVLKI